MLRAVTAVLLATGLTSLGALTGWLNDETRLTAALLELEPLLIVAGIWTAAIARWNGQSAVSLGVTLGLIGGALGARLPYPVLPGEVSPPDWVEPLRRCAAAVDLPSDPVRLVHWTVDRSQSAEELRSVVLGATPDVVVLHGALDRAAVDALAAEVPAEVKYLGEEAAVLARGGFHPCGDADAWSDGETYGVGAYFVGVPPSTVFPLVVARLPGPFGEWDTRDAALTRLQGVVAGLQAPSGVVVADVRAARASRSLSLGFSRLGLASVGTPPTWPARLGAFPLLTMHPHSRVWLGHAWTDARAGRLGASHGLHAPVLVQLAGPQVEEDPPRVDPRRPLDEPELTPAPEE